ncbi:MAG TPA: pyruvate kinase, partial [Rhodospirillales bacterium]|nr:pyruvate kinase [Rhodospirillales bacterium]
EAIDIGRKLGLRHFALSFANSPSDVARMRELCGNGACIVSKIESRAGLHNLEGILHLSDQILVDRGDLSRQVPIDKVPFLQRRIISIAKSQRVPINVATNLLESMVTTHTPTRAEVNDVVSTLLMGADGLVLAAETAIGKYPVDAVKMIRLICDQFGKWTPNTSIGEILDLW